MSTIWPQDLWDNSSWVQGAKKVIFTACHSGKLKLTFTSPNNISTSPKNVLMSRLISQFFCNLNSSRNFTCPLDKLITEFTCPIAKSTSPRLSDTNFFAHWGLSLHFVCLKAISPTSSNCPSFLQEKLISTQPRISAHPWPPSMKKNGLANRLSSMKGYPSRPSFLSILKKLLIGFCCKIKNYYWKLQKFNTCTAA